MGDLSSHYDEKHREYNRRYHAKHRAGRNEVSRKYRSEHLEKRREDGRRWYADNRARLITKALWYNRGVTQNEFDKLLAKQGGVCAICLAAPNGRNLGVDHDHSTGVVRGLLCDRCNLTLGRVHDDQSILKAAAEYLSERG